MTELASFQSDECVQDKFVRLVTSVPPLLESQL